MSYGVTMARRGWLEAGDMMNTLPAAAIQRSAGREAPMMAPVDYCSVIVMARSTA